MSTAIETKQTNAVDIDTRVVGYDWASVSAHLDACGWGMLPKLLTPSEAAAIAGLDDHSRFRSHIVMARHGFGRGEYKYSRTPLPDLVADLRTGAVFAPGPDRQSLERIDGDRRALPGRARGLHQEVPQGWADATDAAPAAIRRRRLQRTAPGRLRRALFFRCRWRFCSRSRRKISPAVSSC